MFARLCKGGRLLLKCMLCAFELILQSRNLALQGGDLFLQLLCPGLLRAQLVLQGGDGGVPGINSAMGCLVERGKEGGKMGET